MTTFCLAFYESYLSTESPVYTNNSHALTRNLSLRQTNWFVSIYYICVCVGIFKILFTGWSSPCLRWFCFKIFLHLVLFLFIIITNLLWCIYMCSHSLYEQTLLHTDIPLLEWMGLNGINLPMQLAVGYLLKWRCCSLVWPQSLLSKTCFDHLGSDQSSFRLSALHTSFVFLQESNLWNKRVISLLLCTYFSLWVCLCTVLLYLCVYLPVWKRIRV